MVQDKHPTEVSQAIADVLLEWRPQIHAEEVVTAIMYALELYSLQAEIGEQVGFASLLFDLKRNVDQRLTS